MSNNNNSILDTLGQIAIGMLAACIIPLIGWNDLLTKMKVENHFPISIFVCLFLTVIIGLVTRSFIGGFFLSGAIAWLMYMIFVGTS